jgi:hypothetical protein
VPTQDSSAHASVSHKAYITGNEDEQTQMLIEMHVLEVPMYVELS